MQIKYEKNAKFTEKTRPRDFEMRRCRRESHAEGSERVKGGAHTTITDKKKQHIMK
jgi:hypothetical protein